MFFVILGASVGFYVTMALVTLGWVLLVVGWHTAEWVMGRSLCLDS